MRDFENVDGNLGTGVFLDGKKNFIPTPLFLEVCL